MGTINNKKSQNANSRWVFGQARAPLLCGADSVRSCHIKCSAMHPTALYAHFKGLHCPLFFPPPLSQFGLAGWNIHPPLGLRYYLEEYSETECQRFLRRLASSRHAPPIRCESTVHGVMYTLTWVGCWHFSEGFLRLKNTFVMYPLSSVSV